MSGARVEVSLDRANRWFHMPDRLSVAPAAEAWPLLAEYLGVLWRETKDAPLPAGLQPDAT